MSVRHHPLTITVHWLTVLLLIAGTAAVFVRELMEDKAIKLALLNTHRAAGLMILLLCGLRLATRWPLRVGEVNAALPATVRLASKLGHGLLYCSLLLIPMLGWALSNARGQSVNFLWVMPLPNLLARNRELAEQLETWHQNLAWGLIALVSFHAAAALWHHYRRKDLVLRSMLPKSTAP